MEEDTSELVTTFGTIKESLWKHYSFEYEGEKYDYSGKWSHGIWAINSKREQVSIFIELKDLLAIPIKLKEEKFIWGGHMDLPDFTPPIGHPIFTGRTDKGNQEPVRGRVFSSDSGISNLCEDIMPEQ